jgi:hypothetical protein
MLHCNMNLMWQSSHAPLDSELFQFGSIVELNGCGRRRERLQRADEVARGRDGEMGQ